MKHLVKYNKSSSHLKPFDNVAGRALLKSRICFCDGRIIFKRNVNASWKVIDPFIASRVNLATSWPLPQKFANSSIPSSLITVESTSKQTTCEFLIICTASCERFDLSVVKQN